MSDFWWPRSIKPLTNKNYSTQRGSNVLQVNVSGGLPRIGLDTTLESPPFNLNFILSDVGYNAFLNFYDVAINHGANSFKMMLDSGTGIVEHQCYIKPGSIKASKPSHGNWYLAATVLAKVTPSQNETCSNLYELYDCYGEQSFDVINGLENFVLGAPID